MKNLKEIFGNRSVLTIGLTTVTFTKNELTIGHNGNMGSSIERSVDPNLKSLGIWPVEKLKEHFTILYEIGTPDYMYSIRFKID